MVESMAPKEKRDWLVPAAMGLGGAGIVAGLYFYTKKPAGFDVGDSVRCRFTFKYEGQPGIVTRVIQLFFGDRISTLIIPDWFDRYWGDEIEVVLDGPGSYEFDLVVVIPSYATTNQKYDAEALIRFPGAEIRGEYLAKIIQDDAIYVRKS